MNILANFLLLFYYLVDSKDCIDQDYISRNISSIQSNYSGIVKIQQTILPGDTIYVNVESSQYKKFSILFIGGLEGNLGSAKKVIELANYVCSKYKASDKSLKEFMNYATFHFVPIGNKEFFDRVSKNCTEDEGEDTIQDVIDSCDVLINPDRNFNCGFKDSCSKSGIKAINNMGRICKQSLVTERLMDKIDSDSYSFIYNIQGSDSYIYTPYDSGINKTTSAQDYFYKTLLGGSDKYGPRGQSRVGSMMDYAMSKKIYSIVYPYASKRLTPQNIFTEIQSIFGPPAVIFQDAKENSKPSSNSKSKIKFETRIRNTYPFAIQVKIELLIRIKKDYLNIILDQETGSLDNKISVKYALLQDNIKKKDFDFSESDYDYDNSMKDKGIFITKLNATIPASSLLYIHPIYTRTVSGDLEYTSALSVISTENRFEEIFETKSNLQVQLSDKSSPKNQVGIILLMFLIFTLVIATILCTILIKNKQYSILA